MTVSATGKTNNLIAGSECGAASGETIEKLNPATGELLSLVPRSDTSTWLPRCRPPRMPSPPGHARPPWRVAWSSAASPSCSSATPSGSPGSWLPRPASRTRTTRRDRRSHRDGLLRGRRGAPAGRSRPRRFPTVRSRSSASRLAWRNIAANTPIANVAWKVFPALMCGNAAVLKASEDTPETALAFARLAVEAGVPPGVLNVVQGLGPEAERGVGGGPSRGDRLVHGLDGRGAHDRAGGRRAPGKVCLGWAARTRSWCATTPTSMARPPRQPCRPTRTPASAVRPAARIIVFDSVYEPFKRLLLERTSAQRVGSADEDDLGPVINERQLENMLRHVEAATEKGATVLAGGRRVDRPGFFMEPTLIEGSRELDANELFGPIDAASRERLRGGRGAGERDPVRTDRGDLDGERPPRAGVHRAHPLRRRGRERADVRLRATLAVRRGRGLRHRLARGGQRGARRVLRPQEVHATPTGRV